MSNKDAGPADTGSVKMNVDVKGFVPGGATGAKPASMPGFMPPPQSAGFAPQGMAPQAPGGFPMNMPMGAPRPGMPLPGGSQPFQMPAPQHQQMAAPYNQGHQGTNMYRRKD